MGFRQPKFSDTNDASRGNSPNSSKPSCSICLELVVFHDGRSCVKLTCGHEFHLDCIGSAFNSRGAMQCPNCRHTEKGQWLYGSGGPAGDDSHDEEFYDLSYSDMSLGPRWCPIIFSQIFSSPEESEYPSSAYRDLLARQALLAERASISYGPVHSSSTSTHPVIPESAYNNHWSTTLSGLNEVPPPYNFPSMNPHYHNWDNHSSSPLPAVSNRLGNADQPVRSARANSGVPYFMNPSLAAHSSGTRASNNMAPGMIPPYPGSGVRTRNHIQAHHQAHFQQQADNLPLFSGARHSRSHRSPSPPFDYPTRGVTLGSFTPVDLNLSSESADYGVEREPDWGFFGSGASNGSDRAPSQGR